MIPPPTPYLYHGNMTGLIRTIRILGIVAILLLLTIAFATNVFVEKNNDLVTQLRDPGNTQGIEALCQTAHIPFFVRFLSPLLGISLLLLVATVVTLFFRMSATQNQFIDSNGVAVLLIVALFITFMSIQLWEPEYPILLCLI